MKHYVVLLMALLLFCTIIYADAPCYYKITVEGECQCSPESGLTPPEGASGVGIYKKYSSSEALYPIVSELDQDWVFSQIGSMFFVDTSEELIFCEGIIQNQGSSADPNFLNCDTASSNFVFDVYGYDPATDEVSPKFTVTIQRLCNCEEYLNSLGGLDISPDDPDLPCNCDCDTDPACGTEDEIFDNQGELKPGQNDPGKPLPPINDPVMPGSGALVAPVADFTVPGRMMDLVFTRTYRGDMEDPGFTHRFYSPKKGQKILISASDYIDDRPSVFDIPVSINPIDDGEIVNQVTQNPIVTYNYLFLEVLDTQWEVDPDCFNVDLGDPNDPAFDGIIQFDDYNAGSVTVTTTYCLFGSNDPNGQVPVIYLNHRNSNEVGSVIETTFGYELSRFSGRLGRKWDHCYNISLEQVADPNEEARDMYILFAGNGKRYLYVQEPDTYQGPSNIYKCSSKTDDILVLGDNGFEVYKKGGTVWKFNSDLRISSIADMNGNQITFSYTNGNLTRVTNDAGNYIDFYYNAHNMIDYVADNFGRTFDYNQDLSFNLTEVIKPTNKDKRIAYTYAPGNLLLTVMDGDNKVWQENTYNSQDRIVTQRYGDGYFNNLYHFDTEGNVDFVTTSDMAGNMERVFLTDTGLLRRSSLEIDGQWADTDYYYDFDRTGEDESKSSCLIEKIVRPEGDIYEYEYDSRGNTTAVTHKQSESDTGLRTEYTYSDNVWSYVESVTDPAGETINYIYDYMEPQNYSQPVGRLVGVSLPQAYVSDVNDYETLTLENPVYRFSYNSYGQVDSIAMPNGTDVKFSYYNGSNKYWLSQIIYDAGTGSESLNVTQSYDYDSFGNITSFTDADGYTTSYAYDIMSRLTEVIDAVNYKTVLTYNRAGLVDTAASQLTSTFNQNTALAAIFEYNTVDRITKITDCLGRITQFGYDMNDNVSSITDPQGSVDNFSVQYGYNSLDLLESITKPEDYNSAAGNDNVTTFTYYLDGLLKTATDANGNVTYYYYDGYRRLSDVVYPDGSYKDYRYDVCGRVVRERKRDGSVICYGYDALGNLIGKALEKNGGVTTFNNVLTDFLATGQWSVQQDPNCFSSRYVYSSNDPNATYAMFGFGLDAGRYAVEISWISLGSAGNPNVEVEIYDDVSGLIDTITVNQQYPGQDWKYLGMYDFLDMPKVKFKSNGDPGITTVDASRFIPATTFEYDAMGRITKGQSSKFTYDRVGRLTSCTDGFGRTVSYEYTSAGRRSKMIWPDGYYVTYGYDAVGRPCSITDANGTLLWSCSYDAAGRRTQVNGLYDVTTIYDYEDEGTGDDDRGLYLENLWNILPSGNGLKFDYTYDLAGNKLTETVNSCHVASYLYDKNYSITEVDYSSGFDLYFDYDNLFNRVLMTEDDSVNSYSTSYTTDQNGLNMYQSVGASNYEYDANGNFTNAGTDHYLYDSQNNLIAYYQLDGDPNEVAVSLYGYDVFGRRTNRSVSQGINSVSGAIAESYLYDGEQVIGEYTSDGKHIKRRFVYGPGIDEPICLVVEPDHQGYFGFAEFAGFNNSWYSQTGDAEFDAGLDFTQDGQIDLDDVVSFLGDHYLTDRPLIETTKRYGYVYDGSGNVAGLTFRNDPNETGNPNEQTYFYETYTYDVFGKPYIYDCNGIAAASSAVENPYMFTGRRYDPESGLYYYRMRMYNPEIGRFMQPDPIEYADGMNMYQYCGNNPVNFVDPWGLSKIGDAVASWARGQEGNTIYGENAEELMYSKFVRDAYINSGAPFPKRWWNRNGSRFWPIYPSMQPPTANEMADPDYRMPNYPAVNGNGKKITASDLQPGDIIAFPGECNGHCGIYLGNGQMIKASMLNPGAIITKVHPREWQRILSGKARVRRYDPTP